MELKLFGKHIFGFKAKRKETVFTAMVNHIKESTFLQDFHKSDGSFDLNSYVTIEEIVNPVPIQKKKAKIAKKEEKKLTPKGVYEAKMLNDESFAIKTDKEYVEDQIEQFKDKLGMISSVDYDMRNGIDEISSLLARLQNRLKYEDHKDFYDNYSYTTTSRISDLIKKHDYLQIGKVEQFLADMPKEAVSEMKAYTKETNKLCGKKPLFYIIADKKDFKKTQQRRDPILLAQSPFGHFWQILGAWDEEMLFLEEL